MTRLFHRCLLLLLALSLAACGGSSQSTAPQTATPVRVLSQAPLPAVARQVTWSVQFAAAIPGAPRGLILAHLADLGYSVSVLDDNASTAPASDVLWLIGNTPLAQAEQPAPDSGVPESFTVTTRHHGEQTIYLTRGRDGGKYDLTPNGPPIGDLYAAYALLEDLGMRFLHPLQPTVAPVTTLPEVADQESPYWPIRAWHIHTQHPLELTHVLEGWGPDGPNDATGWESLLPEWQSFLEWAVANRQNRVEWVLLMAQSWQNFADSPERQARLHRLVDMAHQWGLAVGIDAPIAFRQQHAWIMVRHQGHEDDQIRHAIDWLMDAGFDYLEIEMGFSEFTHPDADKMLDWMNTATRYTRDVYGKPTYVKVHCSQNQIARGFQDPETGAPLNFNFLPYYADPDLGVLPHTVQYYDLEGPALSYGNTDFHYLRRFMQLEAGRREVVYYPETAYWVNYDIDVPLFLPIYAASRLHDLRLLAGDELAGRMGRGAYAGSRIQGQVDFSSGWEWGYWLNDVITARAAWNPHMEISDESAALRQALTPFTSLLGDASDDAADLMLQWMNAEKNLLWLGQLPGEAAPADPALRNAQAYLEGWDTWSEVAKMLGKNETQPRKMGMLDMLNPLVKNNRIPYPELRALLSTTAATLRQIQTAFAALSPRVPASGRNLYQEINDSMDITALRAEQVLDLYQTVANENLVILNYDKTAANQYLNQARDALDKAAAIVARREAHYRADPLRIASWNYNPTAYHFGYLWTVHSLYYWWRDEGKAVDKPFSPGYLNILDPVDIAYGEGQWKESLVNLSWLRQQLAAAFPAGNLWQEMLFEPSSEPVFPQNGLRSRPYWYVSLKQP